MYETRFKGKFKKSYKKILHSGSFPRVDFEYVLSILSSLKPLPTVYHDHALNGDLAGQRLCHIQGDCLLLYEVDHECKIIYLVDIGNHANVLGM